MVEMTKVCVLRSGGDFRPEHVQWLARQVPGIVCLSDVPVDGVKTIPLRMKWPGWWSKMEAFDTSLIAGDVLLIDLDTVVLDLPEMPSVTTVLNDFYRPQLMGSGFMFLTEADRARCWQAFNADPARHMRECVTRERWGDQGFLHPLIGHSARWGDEARSYKAHCKDGVPAGTKVVAFHGKPRPWHVRHEWIPPLPSSAPTIRDFRELILSHKGKRFCIIGGGPGVDAVKQVKADVFISTNAHGAALVKPDYILAMDESNSKERVPMGPYLRARSPAPIISPHAYADLRLTFWPQCPRFVLSGLVATWAAWAMGAKVVILAGFDAYGGDPGYVDEGRKMARDVHCPVRVVGGGPLTKVWPAFDPAERFSAYEPHSSIEGLLGIDGQVVVRARKACTVGRVELAQGQEMTAIRHEVARLLKHRMLEEV